MGTGVEAYILGTQTSEDRPDLFNLNSWKDGQNGKTPHLVTMGVQIPLGEVKAGGNHTLTVNLTDLSQSKLTHQWVTQEGSTYVKQGVVLKVQAPWVNVNAGQYKPRSPVIYAESTQYRWVKDSTEHYGETTIQKWGTAQPAVTLTVPQEGLTKGQALEVRVPPLYLQGELFGMEKTRFYLPETTCAGRVNDTPTSVVRTVKW